MYIDEIDLVWIEKFMKEKKKEKVFRVICLRSNNTKLNVQINDLVSDTQKYSIHDDREDDRAHIYTCN